MSSQFASGFRARLRQIVLAGLLVSGLWLSTISGMSGDGLPSEDPWRRTSTGWERIDHWHRKDWNPPPLHPMVVAALQIMVSLLGFLALERDQNVARRAVSEDPNSS